MARIYIMDFFILLQYIVITTIIIIKVRWGVSYSSLHFPLLLLLFILKLRKCVWLIMCTPDSSSCPFLLSRRQYVKVF